MSKSRREARERVSISQAAYLTGTSVLVCAICCSGVFLGVLKSLVGILKEKIAGGGGGGESDETAVVSLSCSSEDWQAVEDHRDVKGNVGVDLRGVRYPGFALGWLHLEPMFC